jgi:hypothetical protein
MNKHIGLAVFALLFLTHPWAVQPYLNAQDSRLPNPSATPDPGSLKIFRLKDVRPGMKGVGRTIFHGNTISEFNVEILGVVDNFLPNQSVVYAKLSGGPLEETGVFEGMSGSPVYIDGKILGAVAYSFQFSKEAIAGITPLENMLRDVENNPPKEVRSGTPGPGTVEISFNPAESVSRQSWKLVPVSNSRPVDEKSTAAFSGNGFSNPAEMKPIDTPLMLSGFSPSAIEQFAPQFRAMGLNPVLGGALGGSDTPSDGLADASDIEPGSGVGVQLIRGIFGATAAGKVTYRDGNRIYAFGHPFLQNGPTQLPMTKTRIITILPNLMNSNELSVPTELIGTIQQDRNTGISGEIGQQPQMIPITIRVRSSFNRQQVYRFEMVNNRFLTPMLVNFSIFSALTATERAQGESTLQLQGIIALKDRQQVKIENFVSGDANASAITALLMANPVNFLMQSGLKDVQIDAIEVDVTSWDEKRQAVLERIWPGRREVNPGDLLEISALLKKPDGGEIIARIPITIPEQTPAGPLTVSVCDGATLALIEGRETRPTFQPRDTAQLVHTMNQSRQSDRLYVRLTRNEQSVAIYGESYPSIPPSLDGVLQSDRASGTTQTTLRTSPLRTFEGAPMNLFLTGQRSVILNVVR